MTPETRARRRWLAFIAMFFVAQAGLWTWAIVTVSRDASHAVVANYDARALDWDQQRARQQASDALGWHAIVEVAGSQLTVRLVDRDARPLDEVIVTAVSFHKAEAGHREALPLQPVEPGVWRCDLEHARAGHHVIELAATRGDDRFASTQPFVVE